MMNENTQINVIKNIIRIDALFWNEYQICK